MHVRWANSPMTGKAKFEVRREPLRFERIAGRSQLFDHVVEILPHEMRQHEPIVQRRVPIDQPLPCTAVFQKRATQRPQQKLLRQAHPRVRRHLERAELDQAQPAGRRYRAKTACRCRTRRGACCRSRRPANCGTRDRPSTAAATARSGSLLERNLQARTRASRRPSSTRGAWLVGPMNEPENKYDSDG